MPTLLLLTISSLALAEDSKAANGGGAGFPFKVLGATVEPIALGQVWVTAYDMDTDAQADASGYGDPEDDIGFKIKRFRLGLGGQGERWSYRLTVGTSAPYDGLSESHEEIEVVDAFLGAEPVKGLEFRVGQGKVPFSRDALIGAGELTFTERGLAAEHIAPDRSLGLLARYRAGSGGVSAGVFNSGGDLFGDVATGKTIVGRVEWDAGKANTYRTWGDKGQFGLGVGANGYYRMGVATNSWAVGGDAMLRIANLSVLVDGAFQKITPGDTTITNAEVLAETDRFGVTAQVSYQIGQFEPAARFSMLDDSTIGQYMHVLAGAAWHGGNDHVRLGAGYELRLEGEQAFDNDTARLWAQFRL